MALTFTVVFGASLTSVGLIRSSRRELDRNLDRFGRDVIHVHRGIKLTGLFGPGGPVLTTEDIPVIRAVTGGPVTGAYVAPTEIARGEREARATVLIATDPAWEAVNGSTFAAGRFFGPDERDVCVLDIWVARTLFGRDDVTGEQITVTVAGEPRRLEVIGVMEDPMSLRERMQGFDILASARPLLLRVLENKNVYVPRAVVGAGEELTLCLAKHAPGEDPRATADELREALSDRAGQLSVWARAQWIDMLLEAADLGYVFSNAVWALFLAITGAMIMTISLLSISSRTVELGIRRTQGATRWGIYGQILLEGLILGGGGAVVGFALTPAVGWWLCRNLPWTMTVQAGDIAVVTAAGLVVLLGSFFYPALRAGRLEPVEVLREL
jgi:ABC-type antimicrobial peptide transport system permease subunit